jgi:hypothetical protein
MAIHFNRRMGMPQERLANHILPNAATMIGVCVTAVGLVKVAEGHLGPSNVDIYCALDAVVFMASAFSAYLALRVTDEGPVVKILEKVADVFFVLGLIALTGISVLFAYEVI